MTAVEALLTATTVLLIQVSIGRPFYRSVVFAFLLWIMLIWFAEIVFLTAGVVWLYYMLRAMLPDDSDYYQPSVYNSRLDPKRHIQGAHVVPLNGHENLVILPNKKKVIIGREPNGTPYFHRIRNDGSREHKVMGNPKSFRWGSTPEKQIADYIKESLLDMSNGKWEDDK